jgi:hypothetical protein
MSRLNLFSKSRISLLAVVVSTILIASMLLSACAGTPKSESGVAAPTTTAGMPVEELKATEAAEMPAERGVTGGIDEIGTTAEPPAIIERKIIKNANLSLEVEKGKFNETFDKIASLAEQAGGYVSNTTSEAYEGSLASGTITIRVPDDKFNDVLTKVKKLGKVMNINVSSQDVTEEYVDLESRLRNQQAQEAVLLDMMKKATTVQDSIQIQQQLSYIQEQIEIITGRMRYLDNLVSFSTIEIYVKEPDVKPPPTPIDLGMAEALRTAARVFISVTKGLLIFLAGFTPIAILGLIIFFIIWGIIKSRRAKRAQIQK